MADDQNDDQDQRLDISDDDAERLLADDDDDDRNGRSDRDGRRDRKDRGRDKDSDSDSEDDDEELGEPGRRALEAMKEQRKAVRAERDKAKAEAEDLRRKLAKYESANKSELQRLIDERDTLKEQLGQVSSAAKRRDIAEEFAPEHALPKHIRLVSKYLSGKTDEELEASAEELYAQFAPAPAPEPVKSRTPSRPRERMRGGGDPEEEATETDPRKLAEQIRKSR